MSITAPSQFSLACAPHVTGQAIAVDGGFSL